MPTQQTQDARDLAAAIITSILGGNLKDASRLALAAGQLHDTVILVLAGAVAGTQTPESWRLHLMGLAAEEAGETPTVWSADGA